MTPAVSDTAKPRWPMVFRESLRKSFPFISLTSKCSNRWDGPFKPSKDDKGICCVPSSEESSTSKTSSRTTALDQNVRVPRSTAASFSSSDVAETSASSSLAYLRPLDATEVFWEAFHGVGSMVIMNVVSMLTSHPVKLVHLQEVANVLMKRHQVLRCYMAWDDVPNKRKLNQQAKRSSAFSSSKTTTSVSAEFQCRSTGLPLSEWSTACRKNFRWAEMNPAKIDVENAELSFSSSAAAAPESLHWLESLGLQQQVPFDTKKGPLWHLRLLPSVRCSAKSEGEGGCAADSSKGEEKFHYRTYIVGKFHHSVMDGLSRQEFWNEMCCLLAVICHRDIFLQAKDITQKQQDLPYVSDGPTTPGEEAPWMIADNVVSKNDSNLVKVQYSKIKTISEVPHSRLPDSVSSQLPPTMTVRALRPLISSLELVVHLNKLQQKVMASRKNPFRKYGDARVTAHTSIIPLWLPVDVAQRFQQLCKRRQVTVNGAVTIVAALAMAKLMWNKVSVQKTLKDASSTYSNFLPKVASGTNSESTTSCIDDNSSDGEHNGSEIIVSDDLGVKIEKSERSTFFSGVTSSRVTNGEEDTTNRCGDVVNSIPPAAASKALKGSVISNLDDPDCFPLPSKTPSCAVSGSYAPWVFVERFFRMPSSATSLNGLDSSSSLSLAGSPTLTASKTSKDSLDSFHNNCLSFLNPCRKRKSIPLSCSNNPSCDNPSKETERAVVRSTRKKMFLGLGKGKAFSYSYPHNVSLGTMQAISSRRWMPSIKELDKARYQRDFIEYLHTYLVDQVQDLNNSPIMSATDETSLMKAAAYVLTDVGESAVSFPHSHISSSTTNRVDESAPTVVGELTTTMTCPEGEECTSSYLVGQSASSHASQLFGLDGEYLSGTETEDEEEEKREKVRPNSSCKNEAEKTGADCPMERAATASLFAHEKHMDSTLLADEPAQIPTTTATNDKSAKGFFNTGKMTVDSTQNHSNLPSHSNSDFANVYNIFDLETRLGNKKETKPFRSSCEKFDACSSSAPSLPPGLGSYAILMPLQLNINPRFESDPEVFWKYAGNIAKAVQRKVNQPKPTSATLRWQIMSNFVMQATCNDSVLRRVATPAPRPSSFLISNGGKWDESVLLQVQSMLHSEWIPEISSSLFVQNSPINETVKLAAPLLPTLPVVDSSNGTGVSPSLKSTGPVVSTSLFPELFHIKLESSWSCVSQHHAGINLFSHNIVSLGGRMCWSLQYHTNLTNKRLATEYGIMILQVINELVLEGAAVEGRTIRKKKNEKEGSQNRK